MSATSYHPTNSAWLKHLLAREPHQIIGRPDDPYLLRWYVIPRNRFINVYLHKFMRSDVDTLHDHPWWFVSLILRGGYVEVSETRFTRKMAALCRTSVFDVRSPFWRRCIAYRPATYRHQVKLPIENGVEQPCWTLIITGRNTRTWGFWCPARDRVGHRVGERFVPWKEFGDAGCGEVA